jgi:hypothetical protein
MAMWLLILAAPATVILWRVIGVAGAIWRERPPESDEPSEPPCRKNHTGMQKR